MRNAWAEVDDLREHGYGSEERLSLEHDAARAVSRGESWKQERKKQRREAKNTKARKDENSQKDQEAAARDWLEQMTAFVGEVRSGMSTWAPRAWRNDIAFLRQELLENITSESAKQ